MNYSLTTEFINEVPFYKYENNFTFIVNGKKYFTNRVIADILSPIIRNYHFTDESVNEYSFDIDEDIVLFHEFLQLSKFIPSILDEKHVEVYSKYFLELGNLFEYYHILSFSCLDDINEKDIILRLLAFTSKNTALFPQELYKNCLILFSSEFHKIKKSKLKMLDIDLLEGIILCESLKLEDEDSLLYFILDLYEEDHKYARLFEYVVFQNVSKSALLQFFEKFSYEDMNQSLWFSLFSHFYNKNKNDSFDSRYLKVLRPVSSFIDEIKTVFLAQEKVGKQTSFPDL